MNHDNQDNHESEFGYKVRQVLNHGTESLERNLAGRLYTSRQRALSHQRVSVRGLQLAGSGHLLADAVFGHGRVLLAAVALLLGASGTYVWEQYRQAAENEEIDSALLSDDLPPAAYLDHGFRAWLDRSSQTSSQSSQ